MLNKKIKILLIGTNNKGKLKEIRDLIPKSIKTYSTADFNLKSPKENGKTFIQNSLIKSRYFSNKSKLTCISDDSGLEIDILKKNQGYILQDGQVKIPILKKLFKEFIKNFLKRISIGKKRKLKLDLFVLCLFVN